MTDSLVLLVALPVLAIHAIAAVRVDFRLRTFDPAWRDRYLNGLYARRRRERHRIWLVAAIGAAIVAIAYLALGGKVGAGVLAVTALTLGAACTVFTTKTGIAEYRWYRDDGAPREFLKLIAIRVAAFPIGLLLVAAIIVATV